MSIERYLIKRVYYNSLYPYINLIQKEFSGKKKTWDSIPGLKPAYLGPIKSLASTLLQKIYKQQCISNATISDSQASLSSSSSFSFPLDQITLKEASTSPPPPYTYTQKEEKAQQSIS